MAENEGTSSVREEFSKLSLDGKTSFLVEAVFSTAGTAIHEIGERLTSLVDLVTGSMQAAASADSDSDASAEASNEAESQEDNGKKSK